ncbi:MAG: DsbA family protein [Candidatus Falkowbacteria bacterium]|nr:DsbA family protein [Candidatus Falkowbacteria bacterium]
MNPEKSNFLVGLSVGIAIVSLGAMIMMSKNNNQAVVNNTKDNNTAQNDGANNGNNGNNNNNNNNGNNNNANNQPTDAPPAKVDIAIKSDDWVRGKKDAKVTIVEFSDIQCPFCSRFHNTMKQVMAKYPNDVKWVFKHFPLDSIHPYARKAAEAAECAGKQGKFWEYIDTLYANQESLNDDYLPKVADLVKLDKAKFEKCLSSGETKKLVDDDYNEGIKYGVRGTPGNFINGESQPGALPFAQMEAVIKSKL